MRRPVPRLPGRLPLLAPLLALTLLALAGAGAPTEAQTALDIMRKQRDLQRVKDEQEVQQMDVINKAGVAKQRRVVRHTLTDKRDLSKILLRFLAPRDVENTGLLTWEAKGGDDDQWLYLPATKKVKRIASSGKKNRFMGTDFAFEDLRPENLELHRYNLLGSEAVEGQDCWVIEAVPATERQAADSGYSKRKLWVRKDSHYTIKREYYDRKGKLEKIEHSRALVNVLGTVWRANQIEMRDVQEGTRTVVKVESRALNKGLGDALFTEAALIAGGS
ncbi:MAG: outer membrane lipoprotein-sorting protein [Candidatus Rokubacteria bacterium]|nr:outer membrane lipoprotein-sorting protein [Candidatus Rokubacteria bacterium]